MSADETKLPALPEDIASLLADARGLEAPSPDVRTRLRARLAFTMPPPGGGGSGESLPRAPWSRAPWWLVAAAFVAGVGSGRLSLPSPTPAMTLETHPSPPPSDSVPAAPATSSEVQSIGVADLPPLPTLAHPVPAPSASGSLVTSDLAAERRMLAVARTALGRNDAVDALAACEQHAARFPRALLAEEREAIAIQALVLGHRLEDAKVRGERFEATYPKSILLPVVLAALEEVR